MNWLKLCVASVATLMIMYGATIESPATPVFVFIMTISMAYFDDMVFCTIPNEDKPSKKKVRK
jgi:hypothetical protein